MHSEVLATVLLWLCFSGIGSQDPTVSELAANRHAPNTGCRVPDFLSCVTCATKPKDVTLRVMNILKEPNFDMSLRLQCTYSRYLLGMMEEAADKDVTFRFSATYFNRELGWYVDAYNFVYADYSADKSYWQILDGSTKPTLWGASNYIPANGETVTFNLTVGEH